MEIVLIVIVFIALLLFVVWLPFFKSDHKSALQDAQSENLRKETNIELYKEHKVEIEKDFSDGGIDEESYQYLLAELDNSLLQDIETAGQIVNPVSNSKQFSVLWPISLSCFIIVFSIGLYLIEGSLEQLMTAKTVSSSQAQSVEEQTQAQQAEMLAYIEKMQHHLEGNPDDGEAWYNVGQSYVGAGDFDLAIAAFEQVIRIEGEHADLLGAIAQASYYRNNQQIDTQVQDFIDRALALDNNDPSTNILLGMHNFIGGKYQDAIGYWQRVIDANRQGVNVIALKEAVNEANNRLGLPSTSEQPAAAEVTGPQLTVNVSLSEDVAEQLARSEDKVVFVYAIPTDGKRMPLAALKLMASDLPKVVTLNNSSAMSAQNNLSSVDKVHIFAIVSKQGGAGIKPGDFKAEVNNIAVDSKETIVLVIDSLVEL